MNIKNYNIFNVFSNPVFILYWAFHPNSFNLFGLNLALVALLNPSFSISSGKSNTTAVFEIFAIKVAKSFNFISLS